VKATAVSVSLRIYLCALINTNRPLDLRGDPLWSARHLDIGWLDYDDINFEAVSQGYSSKKSDDDILAISNAAICGVGALACKVFAATIRAQHQSPEA
jgi:hypothetical protein